MNSSKPNVLSSRIICRGLFYDKKSKEQHTDVVKPKYVLMLDTRLADTIGVYTSLIATSHSASIAETKKFSVALEEWEQLKEQRRRRMKPVSYFNVTKVVSCNTSELQAKIDDPENGFSYTAYLPTYKWQELQEKTRTAIRKHVYDPKKIEHLAQALRIEQVSTDILKKLGI